MKPAGKCQKFTYISSLLHRAEKPRNYLFVGDMKRNRDSNSSNNNYDYDPSEDFADTLSNLTPFVVKEEKVEEKPAFSVLGTLEKWVRNIPNDSPMLGERADRILRIPREVLTQNGELHKKSLSWLFIARNWAGAIKNKPTSNLDCWFVEANHVREGRNYVVILNLQGVKGLLNIPMRHKVLVVQQLLLLSSCGSLRTQVMPKLLPLLTEQTLTYSCIVVRMGEQIMSQD